MKQQHGPIERSAVGVSKRKKVAKRLAAEYIIEEIEGLHD